MDVSDEEFEDAVAAALDAIPAALAAEMDNVVVLIQDEPEDGEDDLLGYYDGVPLTERGMDWGEVRMPDRIIIFKGPTLRLCRSLSEVRDEVRITVLHEVAHHFGIDDDRLTELGWD